MWSTRVGIQSSLPTKVLNPSIVKTLCPLRMFCMTDFALKIGANILRNCTLVIKLEGEDTLAFTTRLNAIGNNLSRAQCVRLQIFEERVDQKDRRSNVWIIRFEDFAPGKKRSFLWKKRKS